MQPDVASKRLQLNSFFACLRKYKAARDGKADQGAAGQGGTGQAPIGAREEDKPPLPPPAAPPPPGSLQDGAIWGCSRCRWAKTGCLQCDPSKSSKYYSAQQDKKEVQK